MWTFASFAAWKRKASAGLQKKRDSFKKSIIMTPRCNFLFEISIWIYFFYWGRFTLIVAVAAWFISFLVWSDLWRTLALWDGWSRWNKTRNKSKTSRETQRVCKNASKTTTKKCSAPFWHWTNTKINIMKEESVEKSSIFVRYSCHTGFTVVQTLSGCLWHTVISHTGTHSLSVLPSLFLLLLPCDRFKKKRKLCSRLNVWPGVT